MVIIYVSFLHLPILNHLPSCFSPSIVIAPQFYWVLIHSVLYPLIICTTVICQFDLCCTVTCLRHYTAISTLFPYSYKHNIQAYSATHFKYNKQQQLAVSPYSILWALNVGIPVAYKNTLNLQVNLWVFFLHYAVSSTSKYKQDIINLSKHVMDLASVHFHNVSVFCTNERYLCSIYMMWMVL